MSAAAAAHYLMSANLTSATLLQHQLRSRRSDSLQNIAPQLIRVGRASANNARTVSHRDGRVHFSFLESHLRTLQESIGLCLWKSYRHIITTTCDENSAAQTRSSLEGFVRDFPSSQAFEGGGGGALKHKQGQTEEFSSQHGVFMLLCTAEAGLGPRLSPPRAQIYGATRGNQNVPA